MTFYDFLRGISYPFIPLIFPTKVYGKENITHEKAVICCNHLGTTDILLLAHKMLRHGCYCIGKQELFQNKFSAWFLHKIGAIGVRRGESDIAAVRAGLQVLKDEHQLVIFPEGTRNTTGTTVIQPFQPGAVMFALKGQSIVIPVTIHAKIKPFRRSYMMVGEPIDLSSFAELPSKEGREQATQFLFEKMVAQKARLDDIVDNKKRRKQ